jgi:hypothetical protein
MITPVVFLVFVMGEEPRPSNALFARDLGKVLPWISRLFNGAPAPATVRGTSRHRRREMTGSLSKRRTVQSGAETRRQRRASCTAANAFRDLRGGRRLTKALMNNQVWVARYRMNPAFPMAARLRPNRNAFEPLPATRVSFSKSHGQCHGIPRGYVPWWWKIPPSEQGHRIRAAVD